MHKFEFRITPNVQTVKDMQILALGKVESDIFKTPTYVQHSQVDLLTADEKQRYAWKEWGYGIQHETGHDSADGKLMIEGQHWEMGSNKDGNNAAYS